MTKNNLIDTLRKAHDHPNSLGELIELLDLRTSKDVMELDDAGFFKINSKSSSEIVRELIPTILNNLATYHLNNLPVDVRKAISDSYDNHEKKKT